MTAKDGTVLKKKNRDLPKDQSLLSSTLIRSQSPVSAALSNHTPMVSKGTNTKKHLQPHRFTPPAHTGSCPYIGSCPVQVPAHIQAPAPRKGPDFKQIPASKQLYTVICN